MSLLAGVEWLKFSYITENPMPTGGTTHRNSNARALCSQAVLVLSAPFSGNWGALWSLKANLVFSAQFQAALQTWNFLLCSFSGQSLLPWQFFVLPINLGKDIWKSFMLPLCWVSDIWLISGASEASPSVLEVMSAQKKVPYNMYMAALAHI